MLSSFNKRWPDFSQFLVLSIILFHTLLIICSWALVCLRTMCFSNIFCNIWLINILLYNMLPEVTWRTCVFPWSHSLKTQCSVLFSLRWNLEMKMLEVILLSGETGTAKFTIETKHFWCCWMFPWQMGFEGIPCFEGAEPISNVNREEIPCGRALTCSASKVSLFQGPSTSTKSKLGGLTVVG